jgi:hypothetical protein
MHCPHCNRSIAPKLVKSAAAKLIRARATQPPTPKVLSPCPHCGQPFGARELREHKPRCFRNPRLVTRLSITK